MGFKLRGVTVHTLNRQDEVLALAAKLKGYGGTESEREEKAIRKQKIRNKIFAHEMRPFNWAIGEVTSGKDKGLVRRVDGQHSSEVFLELAPEEWAKVRFPVVVTWEENECDTLRDLPVLFEQYNPPWSSRNNEDLIGAHLGIHKDLYQRINRKVADKVTRGMLWHSVKIEGLPKADTRQFDLIHENGQRHDYLVWCGSFLQADKTKELFHPAIMGAVYHTFLTGGEKAKEFWRAVAGGKAVAEEGSPAYKLVEFLEMFNDVEAEWPRTIAKHFNRKGPTEAQLFATCLNAARAHLIGRRLGDVFVPSKSKSVKEVAEEFAVEPTAIAAAA